MDPVGDALIEECEQLMELAHERLAPIVTAAGIPPSATETRTVVEVRPDGNWGTQRRDLSVGALRGFRGAALVQPGDLGLLQGADRDQVRQLATGILDAYRANLPTHLVNSARGAYLIPDYDRTSPALDFDDDPVRWVEQMLVLPLIDEYLRDLKSFGTPEPVLRNRLAEELVTMAADKWSQWRMSINVFGLECPDVLEAGNHKLSPLTDAERGVIVTGNDWSRAYGADLPTHRIDMFAPVVRDGQPGDGMFYRILAALQLNGYRVAGLSAESRRQPEWLFDYWHSRPLPTAPRVFSTDAIDASGWESICQMNYRINGEDVATPSKQEHASIHRFVLGCSRASPTDALLDFVIALEALLLPGSIKTENAYRFRMQGSHYLTSLGSSRGDTFDRLNNLYDTRSRLAHGDRPVSTDEVRAAVETARELAARGLRRAIWHGFPTNRDFKDALLYGSELPGMRPSGRGVIDEVARRRRPKSGAIGPVTPVP